MVTSTARRAPRQRRSHATVSAILSGAEKVLIGIGYDRATTNKIAAAAGVSIGSLYQYFSSKEDIVAALIGSYADRIESFFKDLLEQYAGESLERLVRVLVEGMFAVKLEKRDLFRIMNEQVPRVGQLNRLEECHLALIDAISLYLVLRQQDVEVTNPRVLAFTVVKAIDGILNALVASDSMDEREVIEQAIAMVMACFQKKI